MANPFGSRTATLLPDLKVLVWTGLFILECIYRIYYETVTIGYNLSRLLSLANRPVRCKLTSKDEKWDSQSRPRG